ncbi:MAG: cysteine desulfurase [Chloroflexi bacterium]|nr:MAG: cysteine desulfurase [Chloroflexota bacterium]
MERTILTATDFAKVRADFPILQREIHPGVPVVYLDSTASSQKPSAVIEALDTYSRRSNANIHRGVHTLAEEATALYENARQRIAAFIGAKIPEEIVFTRNTTESINLVMYTWARKNLQPGDVVLLTEMEHHSNIVPWQILAAERGIVLKYIPITADFLFDLEAYRELLKLGPKLVAFTHMSNMLGTITPAKEIVRMAHAAGAKTLIDGAQSVPHFPVNVQDLDGDFMTFSAHKMLGPTGFGVLYGKRTLLEAMPPFMGGGDMIKKVTFDGFLPNSIPHKFEAGTPAIAEAVGLGAAVDYLSAIGPDWIIAHERQLTAYAHERLREIPGLKVYGPAVEHKGGVMSFTMEGIHPHDVAALLDQDGIAVRAGHHCAMPLHQKLGLPATTRASFYLYNTPAEIDLLVSGLHKVQKMFG